MGSSSFRIPCAEPRTWLALAGLCAALVAPLAVPGRALAQANGSGGPSGAAGVDRARAAYDRGVRANAAGDHANAARAFAEADALAPQPASLEAALESAMKADDAPLGADLVERADGRAPDAGLRKTLEAARKRFAGRTGKIRVECRAAPARGADGRCLAAVDGAAADARRPIYVAVGPHAVVVQRGDERIERLVDVKAEAVVVVEAGPALAVVGGAGGGAGPATGAAPAEPSSGLSRGWFYGGLSVTAVFGAITIVSGLDAVAQHDRFVSDGCGSGGAGAVPADCAARGAEGARAETRTNIFLGATAVFAVTTAALGIFAVRWRDGTQARLTFGTTRATATAGFEIVTP